MGLICFLLDQSSGEYFQVQRVIVSNSTLLLDCAPAQWKSLCGPTSSIPLLFLQELPVGKGSETRGEKRDISQGKTSTLSIYVLLENFLGRAEKKRGPTIKLTEDLDPHNARLMLAPKGPEITWISGYQGQPGLSSPSWHQGDCKSHDRYQH